MVGEAIAGLGALKTAFDLAKGLKDIDNATSRNAAVIELQEKILAAQSTQATLIERVGDLEKEMAALKAWGADKARYELIDLHRGLFAYVPRQGEDKGEPPHALCANCYQRGFKSILQSSGHPNVHERTWDCQVCKAKTKNQWADMGALIKKSREPKVQS